MKTLLLILVCSATICTSSAQTNAPVLQVNGLVMMNSYSGQAGPNLQIVAANVVPGATYEWEKTPDLNSGTWLKFYSQTVSSDTGPTKIFVNVQTTEHQMFFRLKRVN